ncbi:MAG: hypothetical protein MUQ56_07040 [Thermoleophilia bacterium]|nr:hypothetical protein [Thermoleophilia bacterium]
MNSRIIGVVLLVIGAGVAIWLGAGIASGKSVTGVALGFVLFSLPFFAVGLYFLLQSKGEIVQQTKVDKERAVLNAVTTRGRVGIADLAIENNASRDEVRQYIYDLIGKGLFTGYVNWDKGELVSAEAAQIKEGQCPNCGGAVELAGKGLVRCPYCGTETYLSAPALSAPALAPTAAPAPVTAPASPEAGGPAGGAV